MADQRPRPPRRGLKTHVHTHSLSSTSVEEQNISKSVKECTAAHQSLKEEIKGVTEVSKFHGYLILSIS
jgi:hypothetical protein